MGTKATLSLKKLESTKKYKINTLRLLNTHTALLKDNVYIYRTKLTQLVQFSKVLVLLRSNCINLVNFLF